MADAHVRPARADDAPAVAALQLRTWRAAYTGVLTSEVLDALSEQDVAARWREAAASPPSPRHRLLVALADDDVVGFAAVGPSEDPDSDPEADAELVELLVDPGHGRAGHGSRLLSACVEAMRDEGFRRARVWVLASDEVLSGFLVSAGWAPDGATRDLDIGRAVPQVRLHTDVRPEEPPATSSAAPDG